MKNLLTTRKIYTTRACEKYLTSDNYEKRRGEYNTYLYTESTIYDIIFNICMDLGIKEDFDEVCEIIIEDGDFNLTTADEYFIELEIDKKNNRYFIVTGRMEISTTDEGEDLPYDFTPYTNFSSKIRK